MSMTVYAGCYEDHPEYGQTMGPVIDFRHWDEEILADDPEAREARGESAFIDNPEFIPNAGLSLSNANAQTVFGLIGFEVDGCEPVALPIDEVQRAALRGLNGQAARHTEPEHAEIGNGGCRVVSFGIPEGYMAQRLEQLLALITLGRQHGATHISIG